MNEVVPCKIPYAPEVFYLCPTLLTLAFGVLKLWEEEGDPGGSLRVLTSASWMQGTILREFSCRDLESLHQTCMNCGFPACSSLADWTEVEL